MNARTPILMPREELLTVDEVAAIYKCCKRSVWNKVNKGALPAPVKWEGLTRWRRSDLNNHIAELAG